MLTVNERAFPYRPGLRLKDVLPEIKPGADLWIVNGAVVTANFPLQDGDSCWLIKRGEIPDAEEIDRLLYARHSPGVHRKVKAGVVGIMGLGGLGSVVAVALARIGIGRLVLADFDVVEPTNLNRQHYYIDQIGMKKTEAMKTNLARINPGVKVETWEEKLTTASIERVFSGVDVLAECFDDPVLKAAALRTVLTRMPNVGYVGASGVAGFGDNNEIVTRQIRARVYLVGDGHSAAEPGQGLMAPRVGIAAHHQANQILRILLQEAT